MDDDKTPVVTIVGVGALGSHAAYLLRNDAKLRIIDFDRVEAKNISSQVHSMGSVRKNKAEAFRQLALFISGTKIEAIPHRLTSENAADMLHGDLIIDAVDNGATRRIIQDHVRRVSLPCLHGALAPNGELGRVVFDELFTVDDEAPGTATCEGGEFLPFIALTGSYLAFSAQAFLRKGKRLNFNVFASGASLV